jgi:hypothetical protein
MNGKLQTNLKSKILTSRVSHTIYTAAFFSDSNMAGEDECKRIVSHF